MAEQTPTTPYLPLRTRFAALIVAHAGRVSFNELCRLARHLGVAGSVRNPDGSSNGSRVGRTVARRMKPLIDEGLVKRDGDDYIATDLADLAAYLADDVDDEQTETERRDAERAEADRG